MTLPLWAHAQIGFKELVDGINWQGTELELISKYPNNIQKTSHEEWTDEGSCSDYAFINVKLGDFIINQAPIRVDVADKSIFRVNFIAIFPWQVPSRPRKFRDAAVCPDYTACK